MQSVKIRMACLTHGACIWEASLVPAISIERSLLIMQLPAIAGVESSTCWAADIGSADLVVCSGGQYIKADPSSLPGSGLGQHVRCATAGQAANARLRLAGCSSAPLICVQVTAHIAAGSEVLLEGPDPRLQSDRQDTCCEVGCQGLFE